MDGNSSSANSSGQGLLAGTDAVRKDASTAVVQVLVWPFIYVDLFMLYVFLRRPLLRAEARYVLFAQTLFADAVFLLLTDFVVITLHAVLLLPVGFCVPLVIFMDSLTHVSPTIIVAMCLERYVAICMPLRHVSIFTPNRTKVVIALVWFLSFIKSFVDLVIFLSYAAGSYFSQLTLCYYEILLLQDWHMAMRANLYILNYAVVLLVLLFCYASIMHIAQKASGDDRKAASKGQRTLLLHLLQLVLCTLEIICPFVENKILEMRDIEVYLIVRYFNFLAFSVLSRATSPLIYGFRDERFYASLKQYAKCGMNSVSTDK
ncbi:odorant receptor 131-2-like [Sardina pilchardus]|uniref:odorant receptor 131-2-like n=1 Tax=Sardina pilchardus TaxID=27697 RepID=UPI002E107C2C